MKAAGYMGLGGARVLRVLLGITARGGHRPRGVLGRAIAADIAASNAVTSNGKDMLPRARPAKPGQPGCCQVLCGVRRHQSLPAVPRHRNGRRLCHRAVPLALGEEPADAIAATGGYRRATAIRTLTLWRGPSVPVPP